MFYPSSISSYDDGQPIFFRCPRCEAVTRRSFRFAELRRELPASVQSLLSGLSSFERSACYGYQMVCDGCRCSFDIACSSRDGGMQGEEEVRFFAVAADGQSWTQALASGPDIANWPPAPGGQVETGLQPFKSRPWYHGGYWECGYPDSWQHRGRGGADCFESPHGGRLQIAFAGGSSASGHPDEVPVRYRSLTAAQRFVLLSRIERNDRDVGGWAVDSRAELARRLKDSGYMARYEKVSFGAVATWFRVGRPLREELSGVYFSGESSHTAYVYVREEHANGDYLYRQAVLIMRSIRTFWPGQVHPSASSQRPH